MILGAEVRPDAILNMVHELIKAFAEDLPEFFA